MLKRKPPKGNVRRVRSNGTTVVGTMVNKAGRTIQFESFAERLLFLRLERDLEVVDYLSQPETLTFLDEAGKRHTYTPDVLVWKQDGSHELHEVTRTERMLQPSQLRRVREATRICAERGWRYILHTELSLPQPTEATNLEYLLCFTSASHDHPAVRAALVTLQATTFSLANLLQWMGAATGLARGAVEGAVGYLIWHRHLDVDLTNNLLFPHGRPHPRVLVTLAVPEEQK